MKLVRNEEAKLKHEDKEGARKNDRPAVTCSLSVLNAFWDRDSERYELISP